MVSYRNCKKLHYGIDKTSKKIRGTLIMIGALYAN